MRKSNSEHNNRLGLFWTDLVMIVNRFCDSVPWSIQIRIFRMRSLQYEAE